MRVIKDSKLIIDLSEVDVKRALETYVLNLLATEDFNSIPASDVKSFDSMEVTGDSDGDGTYVLDENITARLVIKL